MPKNLFIIKDTGNNAISEAKLFKYFDVTSRALEKAKVPANAPPAKKKEAEVILDMAQRYVSDASHFAQKGDWVLAFAALNYAHGWLDAGARLGLLDVDHDSDLFTVD